MTTMQSIRTLSIGDRFQFFPRTETFCVVDYGPLPGEYTYVSEDVQNASPITTRNDWKVWAL